MQSMFVSICSNNPDMLADVLGEMLELNNTMQPHLQRYMTLLNSNSTEVSRNFPHKQELLKKN